MPLESQVLKHSSLNAAIIKALLPELGVRFAYAGPELPDILDHEFRSMLAVVVFKPWTDEGFKCAPHIHAVDLGLPAHAAGFKVSEVPMDPAPSPEQQSSLLRILEIQKKRALLGIPNTAESMVAHLRRRRVVADDLDEPISQPLVIMELTLTQALLGHKQLSCTINRRYLL